MMVQVRILEIDFCDVIMKAMPVLQNNVCSDGSAFSKILLVASRLPREVIGTMLEAIPVEDQREIVSLLVEENREQLRCTVLQLLKQNGIDVSVDEICLSKQLQLCVTVCDVNYTALAIKYLPMIRQGVIFREHPVLATLLKLPDGMLRGAISKIPQDQKDKIIAAMINKNTDTLITKIEEIIACNDLHVRLGDLSVQI